MYMYCEGHKLSFKEHLTSADFGNNLYFMFSLMKVV